MTSTPMPEGISTADLASLMDKAPSDADNIKSEGPFDGSTAEQLLDFVDKALDSLREDIGHPLAHKVIALTVLGKLIEWHQSTATQLFNDDLTAGLGWAQDGGKLQVAYQALRTVQIGEEDFTIDPSE